MYYLPIPRNRVTVKSNVIKNNNGVLLKLYIYIKLIFSDL